MCKYNYCKYNAFTFTVDSAYTVVNVTFAFTGAYACKCTLYIYS